MSKSITRKQLTDLLRRIKQDQRTTPETWKNMLFYNLAYALSHKGNRTLARVMRTAVLKVFGDTKESQEEFSKEFKAFVDGLNHGEEVKQASQKAIAENQGVLDALADK